MGNNFCSKCQTKQGQTALVLFDCRHHTCINCIKSDPAFQCQYRLIQCKNCKLKSLINASGGCEVIVLDIEWHKCKKNNFRQNDLINQKDYYIWLRQKKIELLDEQITKASKEKISSAVQFAEQFEKSVINNSKLNQKNEVLSKYQSKILQQYEQKRKKVEFEQEYLIDGMVQKIISIQLCKICFKNKAQYCFNTCGHVCVCQNHSSQAVCPVCKRNGKTIKISFKN